MANILEVFINGDAKGLNKSLSSAQSKLKAFGKQTTEIGKRLSTRLTLPIGLAGASIIKLASDTQESLNKVDVAFKDSSQEIKDFAKTTLKQFGIARGQALDMAALFGDMSTSMGLTTREAAKMSTSLVGLAGDLASFKNINIEEVTTALAGVFTGETESLKRLGIVMTEINLQQFAMERGMTKSIKKMTQAEKVALRYEFIMSKTVNAQGDFARTNEGAANQMRMFGQSLKEFGSELGERLLPNFEKVMKKLNDLLDDFKGLDVETQNVILAFAGITAIIPPLLILIGSMATGFTAVTGAVKSLTLAMAANPIGAITIAVTTLTAAFIELLHQLNPAVDRINTFINFIKSGGSPTRFLALQAETMANNLKKQNKEQKENNKQQEKSNENTKQGVKQNNNLNQKIRETVKTASELTLVRKKGDREFIKGTKILGAFRYGTDRVSGSVKLATDGLKKMNIVMPKMKVQTKGLSEGVEQLSMMVGDTLIGAFEGLMNGENFFKSVIRGLISLTKKLAAAAAAAAVLALLLPGGGAKAGKALSFGARFKEIFAGFTGLAFANGGVISGPTLGLMGEYPGARSNPEVVAPLDKLKSMIGGGQTNVTVSGGFRLDGQDLVLALERANRNNKRFA